MTFKEAVELALFTAAFTFLANLIFSKIKISFNLFEQKRNLKREYSFSMLTNLYLELYAIIAQSEYVRYFHSIDGNFDDVPFLELSQKKITTKINFSNGSTEIKTNEFSVKDAITEFSKENIAKTIFENKKYASQTLLKLAVAYRYINKHYLDKTLQADLLERFQVEELITIRKMVVLIVKETNELLKICGMDYNSSEMESGHLVNGIVD